MVVVSFFVCVEMEGKEMYCENTDFKLSDLTDDQLLDLMDSVDTDEECSSDDEYSDLDFVPDEITVEKKEDDMTTINRALDESEIGAGPSTSLMVIATTITGSPAEDTEVVESSFSATETVALAAASLKPPKRARSPLPSIESTGPSITPSARGFTCSGTYYSRLISSVKNTSYIFYSHSEYSQGF